jgi:hypothetical protein
MMLGMLGVARADEKAAREAAKNGPTIAWVESWAVDPAKIE